MHATLAVRRLALSASRSPAPCAVPPLTTRRLALSLSQSETPPGDARHLSPLTCACKLRRALHATLITVVTDKI
eukprot:4671331-Pleurochrysis_carterae.AAC.2